MKRRDSLKTLLIGTITGATLGTAVSCKEDGTTSILPEVSNNLYGRTPAEQVWDTSTKAATYLTTEELEDISILCDIILPATEEAGAATAAEVPAFIEFIVKDLPSHQLPIRGGLMWLNGEASNRYNKAFKACSNEEQIAIIDDIAYPDPNNEKPAMAYGITFFDRMRNLTMTGYYTTRMGLDDLGYNGNYANTWDGVPAEVLAKHEVEYDPEWIAKCVDQSKRLVIAEWDEEGNLLT